VSSSAARFLSREVPNTLDWPGRFRLTAGIVVCYTLFWWASRLAGVPPVIGLSGSLLMQPSPGIAMATAAGTLLICTLAGKLLVGDLLIGPEFQFEGGLLAALVGMIALVFRVGSVRYALFSINDPKTYLVLAAELALLYCMVGICWLILRLAHPPKPHGAESWATRLGATVAHMAVMTACMIFFSQSDATGQGLAAVGLSALLASMAAHMICPARSSFWYWLSPLLVGVIGYAIAYANPDGLAIGFPDGPLGSLARPTPLAYAAAGPAGAIFGFWTACRWSHEQAQQGKSA
jgi:hypothetical protein